MKKIEPGVQVKIIDPEDRLVGHIGFVKCLCFGDIEDMWNVEVYLQGQPHLVMEHTSSLELV